MPNNEIRKRFWICFQILYMLGDCDADKILKLYQDENETILYIRIDTNLQMFIQIGIKP